MENNNKSKAKQPIIKESPVTYDMYADMPDDGQRYEIIDGILELMTPGPSTNHQIICGEIGYRLMSNCRSDYLIYHAPLDVILSDINVVQPDLIMIHRSRLHIVTKRGVEGAPDLVVEVLSPGSRKRNRVIKQGVYAEHGVPEYWIVDADARTLELYRLFEGESSYALIDVFEGNDAVASDRLPCVSFMASDIFRELIA